MQCRVVLTCQCLHVSIWPREVCPTLEQGLNTWCNTCVAHSHVGLKWAHCVGCLSDPVLQGCSGGCLVARTACRNLILWSMSFVLCQRGMCSFGGAICIDLPCMSGPCCCSLLAGPKRPLPQFALCWQGGPNGCGRHQACATQPQQNQPTCRLTSRLCVYNTYIGWSRDMQFLLHPTPKPFVVHAAGVIFLPTCLVCGSGLSLVWLLKGRSGVALTQ